MFRLFSTIVFIIMTSIMYGQKKNYQIKKQIKMDNATILHKANEFVKRGEYESFLAYCTEDTQWVFIGERTLKGKGEVREYMKEFYWEPPFFTVETTIEDGNFVTVTGEISLKTKNGILNHYEYCDIWRFENGKIAALKAYVVEKKVPTDHSLHQTGFNLEDAIYKNDLRLVEALLKNGNNAEVPNSKRLTPLMIASGLGHLEIVKLLTAHGVNILAVDPDMGSTALHKAAQSGHPKIIQWLLEKGAFIDFQSPVIGNSPLMDAILYKQEAAVKILLEHKARIELRNNFNECALDIAHQINHASMISIINNHKNNLEKEIQSQKLVRAIKDHDIKTVKDLIDRGGAHINERIPRTGNYNDDFTPLSMAASMGHEEIVLLLLGAGADITMLSGLMGATVLHEAAYAGHAKVIDVLMQYTEEKSLEGLDINAQGLYNGMTALHDAVWQNKPEAVKILVDKGADVNLTSHSGLKPLELAELFNYSGIIRLLKDAEKNNHSEVPDSV